MPPEDFNRIYSEAAALPHEVEFNIPWLAAETGENIPWGGEEPPWLRDLASVAMDLPQAQPPRLYHSQHQQGIQCRIDSALPLIAHSVRSLVEDFLEDGYFAEAIGCDCLGEDSSQSAIERELEKRVRKSHLWSRILATWTEEDLYDLIEVFHDLSSRPTKLVYVDPHGGSGHGGWHPQRFSRQSGQALYRWRINRLLDATTLIYRIADAGEDMGRMVRAVSGEMGRLVDEMLSTQSPSYDEVAQAIALFRSRNQTRENRRLAIVALAGVLERRRALLKDRLLRRDEGALFAIANSFDLRHRNTDQYADYGQEFLDWIFYWYLATVQLFDQVLARRAS